jgi:hypothetical protein
MTDVIETNTVTTEEELDFQVQLNYRSGHSVTLWFEKFEISSNFEGITKYSFVLAENQGKILFLGANDIESALQVDQRVRKA